MQHALPFIQIVLSILLIITIILQQSEAGMGGAFGDTMSSAFHTRRGIERTLFFATIVLAVLFAASAFTALILR